MPLTHRRSHHHLAAQLGDKASQSHRPRHLAERPELVPVIGLLRRVDDVEVGRGLLLVTAHSSDQEPLGAPADRDHEEPRLVIADRGLGRAQRLPPAGDDIDQSF